MVQRRQTKVLAHGTLRTEEVFKATLITLGVALFIGLLALFVISFGDHSVVAVGPTVLIQDGNGGGDVMPTGVLQRISWGAILAGALVALMLQLAFNLLGISIGAAKIAPDYVGDSPDVKGAGIGVAIWTALGTLISLFAGGWIAARFAGLPTETDGMLHGIVTWSLVTLISLFLLATGVGRIMSGVSSLIGQGLSLAGRATAAAASGAASVAGTAVRGAANVAGDVAQGAAHLASNAADTAGDMAQDVSRSRPVREARNMAGDAIDMAITRAQDTLHRMGLPADPVELQIWVDENMPEVAEALDLQELSFESILYEAQQMMRESGMDQRLRAEGQAAMQEARDAAFQGVTEGGFDRGLELAMRRVMRRARGMVSPEDREMLVQLLVARTGMNEQQINEQIDRWTGVYERASMEVDRARNAAMERIDTMRQEAMQKAEDLRRDAMMKLEDVRRDAERAATEAAQATSKAISRAAAAAFLALLIGAAAAGIGGMIGAPDTLPDNPAVETQF